MARTKYGRYLHDESFCYVISNADLEYAEDVAEESFINPPIKMTVEAISQEWERAFDAEENFMNHSKLRSNLISVLRGEQPEFRLTGVNVSADSIYLVYNSVIPPEKFYDGTEGYSGGQVLVYGEFTLLFEVEYLDGSPTRQYRIESRKTNTVFNQVQVTEYIGGHKYRKLDFGQEPPRYIDGMQYCVVTEY